MPSFFICRKICKLQKHQFFKVKAFAAASMIINNLSVFISSIMQNFSCDYIMILWISAEKISDIVEISEKKSFSCPHCIIMF